MLTKTATTKKAATAVKSNKNQFQAKKIGANIIVTFNSEKYSRKVSKDESDILMRKMSFYNKKPSETGKRIIVKLLTPEATKKVVEKEKVEAEIKGYKKLQKKADKKTKVSETVKKDIMQELEEVLQVDKESIVKVEAILAKFKTIEVPQKEVSSYRRSGEH